MKNGFFEKINIIGRERNHMFWKAFKEKHPKYKDISHQELTSITNKFFAYVGDLIIKSQHGVILNGIGYFANPAFEEKKVLKIDNKLIINVSDKNIYTTYFFPRIFKKNPFNGWSFKLYRPLKNQMKSLIQGGIKYMCHYDILKTNGSKNKYYINDK